MGHQANRAEGNKIALSKRPFVKINEHCLKPLDINWNICLICQTESKEPLVVPTDVGYTSLVENLQEYAIYSALPTHLTADNLLDNVIKNQGKYHKICRSRFNSQKINRMAKKKKLRIDGSAVLPSQTTDNSEAINTISDEVKTKEFFTRSQHPKYDIKLTCLFCEKDGECDKLVSVATLDMGSYIYENALLLGENKLITKISEASNSDLVALKAKYHKRCYVDFRNKVRDMSSRMCDQSSKNTVAYGSVISELVKYLQDSYLYNKTAPVFYLSKLTTVVEQRLQELGFPDLHVNRTRLKKELLSFTPGLREDKVGKDIVLSFEGDVHNAIRDACNKGSLSDGMCLARAAEILREDMFTDYPEFDGSFKGKFSPVNCVSSRSLLFFKLVLEGGKISEKLDENQMVNANNTSKAALTIAQLVRFNAIRKERKDSTKSARHSLQRETPLPLYIGLLLHTQTGCASIIDKFSNLGLSVSYKRVKSIMTSVSSSICDHFENLDCVCPPSAVRNVFTCAAIDNVDHNTSSNTSVEAFHGTTISLIQYISEDVQASDPVKLNLEGNSKTGKLPETYTTLPPTPKFRSEVPLSTINTEPQNLQAEISPDLLEWLVSDRMLADCDTATPLASYFSKKEQTDSIKNKCKTILLPILNESINSPAVVRHATDVVTAAINHINPNQIPVITADQPVYALLKTLQWAIPDKYGENKIVVLLGGLHIEMAVASAVGTWLDGSGWTDNLVEANVTTSGRVEGLLKASHVKRTRYVHEVSVVTLQLLLERAFQRRKDDLDQSFEQWIQQRSEQSAQFKYWLTAKLLESLLLDLVRSILQGKFTDFVLAVERICPWMFALDHTNYARWLPVFLYNLKQLPEMHPSVYDEFMNGKMSGSKTCRRFSGMAHDHLHEQNNKLVKSNSNNLTRLSNENNLIQWVVAGPEVARMIGEFEEQHNVKSSKTSEDHHEDTPSFSARFQTNVTALLGVYEEHGNPFEDEELTTVNSSRIVLPEINVRSVQTAEELGKRQFEAYTQDRLIYGKVSIHEVIKRNNLPLMSKKKVAVKSKDKQHIIDLRRDSSLFAKLFVASQVRHLDISDFFAHENSSCPPSLSEMGKLRKPTKKSDIVTCIINTAGKTETTTKTDPPNVSSLIIDGAALVHMLPPRSVVTFQQYFDQTVQPYILTRLKSVDRLDLVFDQYIEGSLKSEARISRGNGPRINVKANVTIPKSFNSFLANEKNKEDLFSFLAENAVQMRLPVGKQVFSTLKDKVVCSDGSNLEQISPVSHEEADARLFLHAWHASEQSSHTKVSVKTVDSDVVVIAVYAFSRLTKVDELWIEYGTGKHLQFIPIHEIQKKLPEGVPELLLFFHAFTGADTVSSFAGIGKNKSWKTWMTFREVDKAFLHYTSTRNIEDDASFALIQRFVNLMYQPTSTAETVNEARRVLFTQYNRPIENIPPTSNALIEHTKRASLQCFIWTKCLQKNFLLLDPCQWGWEKVGEEYKPLWSSKNEVLMAKLQELTACNCKSICNRCKCAKSGLRCTLLCKCEGQCYQ